MQKFLKSLKKRAEVTEIDPATVKYAGLNIRLIANMIDMLVLIILTIPFLLLFKDPGMGEFPAGTPDEVVRAQALHNAREISNQELMQVMLDTGYAQFVLSRIIVYGFINTIIMGVVYVAFWRYFNSSPGKMVFGIKIFDAKTFRRPSTLQYMIRFLGYIVSTLTLCLGFIMIGLNRRKRGLHDIMAGTVVVYTLPKNPEWEKKKLKYQTYFMLIILIIGAIYVSGKF